MESDALLPAVHATTVGLELPAYALDNIARWLDDAGRASLREIGALEKRGGCLQEHAGAHCDEGGYGQRLLVVASEARRAANEAVTAICQRTSKKVSNSQFDFDIWCYSLSP